MGKLLFTIVAAMAEMERSILIERVRAGVTAAKAKGKSCGRPKKVFRRDTAIEMRSMGYSWRRISRLLNVPVSTVRDECAETPCKSATEIDGKQGEKIAAALMCGNHFCFPQSINS
jgi:DNA invertase Pin-like site-specific DNA recombinase